MKPLPGDAKILPMRRGELSGLCWWTAKNRLGEMWGHGEVRVKKDEPAPEPPPRDSPGWFYRGSSRVA